MTLKEKFLALLEGKKAGAAKQSDLSEAWKISQGEVSKLLKKNSPNPGLTVVSSVLEGIGAKIIFPGESATEAQCSRCSSLQRELDKLKADIPEMLAKAKQEGMLEVVETQARAQAQAAAREETSQPQLRPLSKEHIS